MSINSLQKRRGWLLVKKKYKEYNNNMINESVDNCINDMDISDIYLDNISEI